ncbi:hypothetical protein [Paracoccus sp. PAR01]|uniref:hypothetical protein n=1 Tax=Paracoccus sp. PAR01 TaxID=2769282 RepID=UPI001CE0C3E4|nr:hypothetical protein [Paracoccus sp. PAR01]
MSGTLRLTAHDRVMISALSVLSRPALTDRTDLEVVVGILRDVVRRVSRNQPRLAPLIIAAEQFVAFRTVAPGYYGGLHDCAWRVMNAWDWQRLADGWDHVRSGGA